MSPQFTNAMICDTVL